MKIQIIPAVSLALLMFPCALAAQSTLFNVPTTDTVAKGKTYFELDYLPQLPKRDNGNRLSIVTPRFDRGIGETVEAGANLAVFHLADSTSAFIQGNIKWRFADNVQQGLAAAVGGVVYTPLNHRTRLGTLGVVYGSFSKKDKRGNYTPRFTAGPYGVVGAAREFQGPEAGVILGYEQPIQKKINIVAEWFSGRNIFGNFTPGISMTLPKNSLLNAGYSIGNDSWINHNATRNRFLFLSYGITL